MTTTVTAAMPATVHLRTYLGDTWTQQFRFLADGQPLDLTGFWIRSAVRGTNESRAELVVGEVGEGTISLHFLPRGSRPTPTTTTSRQPARAPSRPGCGAGYG